MDAERQIELDCLASIFPEIQFDQSNIFTVEIEIPVHPSDSVNVTFPSTSTGLYSSANSHSECNTITLTSNVELRKLSHLPPLNVRIKLPEGYPETVPPDIDLYVNPKWLSDNDLNELKVNATSLWVQAGGSVVLYDIIDFLKQAAGNAFGYGEKDKILRLPEQLKIPLLDFNINEDLVQFKKMTIHCSICLDHKKGALCHRMLRCDHIFCVKCLQDFYVNAINTGDITTVRCLAPECMKKSKYKQKDTQKHRKLKTLGPSELLQIPIDRDVVTRYVKLKHKIYLESNKNTVYCPRKWCGGAARITTHHKPSGLDDELSEESDSEVESPNDSQASKELLSICEDCTFAFCRRCLQSWHGEFTICIPKVSGEITKEEKASLEYIRLHTTPCPTCAVHCQKSHGCNHMICYKCSTHFCYLCSSWLSPSNPYKHYNSEETGCYMRLWESEDGDTDDVEIGFAGGGRNIIQENEIEIHADFIQEAAVEAPAIMVAPTETLATLKPVMEREGPLVLRINHVPQAAQEPLALQPAAVDQPKRREQEPEFGPRRRVRYQPTKALHK